MECDTFTKLSFTKNIEGTLLVFGEEVYIYDNLVSIGKLPDYERKRLGQEIYPLSITTLNLSKVGCVDGMWIYLLHGKKVVCVSNEKLFLNFVHFQTLTFENQIKMLL